jgi:hypothetical protein
MGIDAADAPPPPSPPPDPPQPSRPADALAPAEMRHDTGAGTRANVEQSDADQMLDGEEPVAGGSGERAVEKDAERPETPDQAEPGTPEGTTEPAVDNNDSEQMLAAEQHVSPAGDQSEAAEANSATDQLAENSGDVETDATHEPGPAAESTDEATLPSEATPDPESEREREPHATPEPDVEPEPEAAAPETEETTPTILDEDVDKVAPDDSTQLRSVDESRVDDRQPPAGFPSAVWERIQAGNDFNVERRPYYDHSEVRTENGHYIDSYNHGEEIVERKHSQLADIQESTALKYLEDTARKYSPGEVISDTPKNREELPEELIGQKIDGQLVLEVPEQWRDVPAAVTTRAAELGIIIRDTNNKEYQ